MGISIAGTNGFRADNANGIANLDSPTETLTGDLLVVCSTSRTQGLSAPSGFTRQVQYQAADGALTVQAFYGYATSDGQAAYSFTGGNYVQGITYAIRSDNGQAVMGTNGSGVEITDAQIPGDLTVPGLTAGTDGFAMILVADGQQGTASTPSGWTKDMDDANTSAPNAFVFRKAVTTGAVASVDVPQRGGRQH